MQAVFGLLGRIWFAISAAAGWVFLPSSLCTPAGRLSSSRGSKVANGLGRWCGCGAERQTAQ